MHVSIPARMDAVVEVPGTPGYSRVNEAATVEVIPVPGQTILVRVHAPGACGANVEFTLDDAKALHALLGEQIATSG